MALEEKVKHLLDCNVEEVTLRKHLEDALHSGKKLRVKLGIDPTSPDLHLGHAVVLRKLKEFQDLGHQIVLIIGDFTARIGDPSGRAEARKPLTEADIKKNMKAYLAHAGKIIDVEKAEISHNSEWFLKEGVQRIIELSSMASMQQILKRADFKKRLAAGKDITLLEVFYPLFQGYDSVAVKADVELGGTDQTFNLLMGRQVQRHFGMREQDVLTVPLLEGLDGVKKMSKSAGNYIGLDDEPGDMFGKVMSLPDKLMGKYFLLATELDKSEVKKLQKELGPRDLKARLAFEIVKLYHGDEAARAAEEKFGAVFSRGEMPEDLPALQLAGRISVLDMVIASGAAKSKSEARRLIEPGAVKVDGNIKKDSNEILELVGGEVVRIGKKHFFRVSA
jgi:tyrosyl-tRNA synthetase